MSRDDDQGSGWQFYHPWMRAYYGEGAVFLTERTLRRIATYHRDVAGLAREGSAEPRLWIGSLQNLWSGLADDYGDYLRTYVRGDEEKEPYEVASDEPLVVTTRICEGAETDQQSFDLPRNLFDSSVTRMKLSTRGLFSGSRCALRPGQHVTIEPSSVTREDHRCKIRFENLPKDLQAGMVLVGTIVAEPSEEQTPHESHERPRSTRRPLLVAIVQVKII